MISQVLVRLIVVGELLADAIPLEIGSGFMRDVPYQRGRGRTMAGFNVAVTALAAANAVEEVARENSLASTRRSILKGGNHVLVQRA